MSDLLNVLLLLSLSTSITCPIFSMCCCCCLYPPVSHVRSSQCVVAVVSIHQCHMSDLLNVLLLLSLSTSVTCLIFSMCCCCCLYPPVSHVQSSQCVVAVVSIHQCHMSDLLNVLLLLSLSTSITCLIFSMCCCCCLYPPVSHV